MSKYTKGKWKKIFDEKTVVIFQNRQEFTELVNIINKPLISKDYEYYKWIIDVGFNFIMLDTTEFVSEMAVYRNKLKVITVSKFKEELNKMKDEFENGELIEVSDNKVRWYEKFYIGRNSNSPTLLSYVSSDSEGHVSSWRYARKIQPVEEMTMGEVCKALGKTIKIVS